MNSMFKMRGSRSPAFSELDLVRSVCRESFFEFFKEFWDVFVAEELTLNWHIEFLCNEMQEVAERVFRNKPKEYDLIVNISPGTTKSSIVSVAFPAWVWTRMPSAKIIAGSHTWELVQDLARKSRDVILDSTRKDEKPSYLECFPEIELREDQNTKALYANNLGGWRKGVTVGGKTPMGFHAHFLIIDDPIDPQKANSKARILAANQWMNDTLPSRKVNKAVTPTILIMQRIHQNDPTGNWLRKEGSNVKHICLPADCRQFEVIPPEMKKYYVDGLMDPKRMSRKDLKEIESKSQYSYAAQYGQNPIPPGGGMFKVTRFVMADSVPSHIQRTVRYWDKASTADDGDFTVGTKLGVDAHGYPWLLDVIRGQWDTHERDKVIKATAIRDTTATLIGIEQDPGGSGKDSAQDTAKKLNGYRVVLVPSTGDKATRAEPYSSQVNAGNVRMVRAHWNQEYIEELRYFPNSTNDDQVDASSGAFNLMFGKRIAGGLW